MSSNEMKYGIFIQNELLTELSIAKQQRTALVGEIVKIDGVLGNENLAVRFRKSDGTWESTTFRCNRKVIEYLNEKWWEYFAAIHSPIERAKLAKNKEKCEKLNRLIKDITVGFIDTDDVHLGQVKYLGNVKGMGKCVGIQLNQKKKDNKCDGSCAGIQYFKCQPGYGLFTTIDKISLPATLSTTNYTSYDKHKTVTPITKDASITATDLDICLEKNVSSLLTSATATATGTITSTNTKTATIMKKKDDLSPPQYEQIVTKYGEYPKNLSSTLNTINKGLIRSSQSLQDIIDVGCNNSNSNNDFDQNSVIQPDKIYLLSNNGKEKIKNKSELNLMDIIGNSWHGANNDINHHSSSTDSSKYLNNTSKTLDRNDNYQMLTNNSTIKSNGTSKTLSGRNKSINPLSHFYNGTYPKRPTSKFYTNGDFCDKTDVTSTKKDDKKINERNEALAKSSSSSAAAAVTAGAATTINTHNNHETTTTITKTKYVNPKPGTTNDLTIGSLVEVLNDVSKEPLYGVVRWMGCEHGTNYVLVGVELEEEQSHLPLTLTDGTHNGERMFKCLDNRALFVPIEQCHKDSRFQDGVPTPIHQAAEKVFDSVDCPVIQGAVAPLCMPTEEDVEAVCGKFRGIQGHHNSCYLDVTLFAMFTYTAVFDSLLFRPKGPNDIDDYEEVQRVLREEIVNPLRKNLYVSANHVMNLRKLLDRLSSVSGLTSEEKDPEEFLNSLLAQILKHEPFLKLNSGQESFYYQLFVEKDADLTLPTVQQLFEQSFLTSNIKLKEVPSCLIIQMPRFGKNYKMYPRILPSQLLDVTDIIEGLPRLCTVCGKLAWFECRECFDGISLETTAFCKTCLKTVHRHERRSHHKPNLLEVTQDFSIMEDHCRPPRLYMELFAVICIETSHYVTFVKCGVGHEAPWCFFDSMADRKGEKNGYNIPEMVACPDISQWLSDDQICRHLHEEFPLDRHLPEHARRLLCDAYICMYQSSDVMMYR